MFFGYLGTTHPVVVVVVVVVVVGGGGGGGAIVLVLVVNVLSKGQSFLRLPLCTFTLLC